MGYRLNKTVVLVGMMGAGKSAVGRVLADILDVPFLDSDAEIEHAANMTIPEIFARDGEPFFREREAQVISRLLVEAPGILSTGGGAYMQEANRAEIHDKGVAVWLDADLDLLWSRVRHRDTRPLLRTPNPRATLSELYRKRVPIYALAELRVRADPSSTLHDMARRVVKVLLNRPDVLEKT